MKTFAFTHTGLQREKNEDRYLIKELGDGSFLLAVADGMGGEAAGEYAAEIIRNNLCSIRPGRDSGQQRLADLVKEADKLIQTEVEKNPNFEGMGTTVTGILLSAGLAQWVHVGDSRLYVLRDRALIQITKDQNMAQFLLDEGEITEQEARTHSLQKLLDQCVGCGSCKPETGHFRVNSGDLIILTTDGLHGELPADSMASFLNKDTDTETKVRTLLQAALDKGGNDNITIVAAEI